MADFINFEAEADFCQNTTEDVGEEVSDFLMLDLKIHLLMIRMLTQMLIFTDILKVLKIILNRF